MTQVQSPEGVNAVVAGDLMRGEVQGLGSIEVRVSAKLGLFRSPP